METQIKVGIADYKVTRFPYQLMTIGLGSCVGIALYEPVSKTGGLSHIMLPDSTAFRGEVKAGKFADLALPQMISQMREQTGSRPLTAKIAGGASMFQFSQNLPQSNIGSRNVEAVKRILAEQGIPLFGEETGGSVGRTMYVDLETFAVKIRTAARDIIEL